MDVASQLRATAEHTLNALIPANAVCAVLDYSSIRNTGDALLYQGAYRYLESRGATIVYEADHVTFDADHLRSRLPADGIILFHGGGNMNNIWPGHMEFRFRVLKAFPDHRIIQLPQSVFFDDPEMLRKTKESFTAHRDYVLCARDQRSFDYCRDTLGVRTELCPDMAFFLPPRDTSGIPKRWHLAHFRQDKERASDVGSAAFFRSFTQEKWLRGFMPSFLFFLFLKAVVLGLRRIGLKTLARPFADFITRYVHWYTEGQFRHAYRALHQADLVVTDRLHVFISCVLFNIPNVILDNSYGKLQNFYHTWLEGLPLTRLAATETEAVAQVQDLERAFNLKPAPNGTK